MMKDVTHKFKLRYLIPLLLLYMIGGAILPFLRQPKISEETASHFSAESFYGGSPSGERAAIISDNGDALSERIRLIAHARERIVLSTFDFHDDEAGMQVLAALLDAADRGVKVQLLVDGVSVFLNFERNPHFYALAGHKNAEIRSYNPVRPWFPWTLMGRLHDKYLVVDETAYILGGRNTYSFFLGSQDGIKNYDWDALVYCENGTDSLRQVTSYFDSVWNSKACKPFHNDPKLLTRPKVIAARDELRSLYQTMQEEHPHWFTEVDYLAFTEPANQITLLSNPIGIYAKEPQVFYQLTELMSSAKKEVVFHTPYLICNQFMLDGLSKIASSVPSATMLTNSVANNGNLFGGMDYLFHKQEIVDTGLQILEYESGISYHGKCMTMDDRITAIGSFNFDMRSTYLDTELMLVIDSSELNPIMRREMEAYEDQSLTVIDSEVSVPPAGVEAMELPKAKSNILHIVHFLGGWARFLF